MQTSLKIHNELTEEDRICYFHSLIRGDDLQTFKNVSSPSRVNLADILTVFRRKNVKHQSIATAEHKFERLVFKPANQNITDFLDELQKLAEDAFGVAAQAIVEQFIYAELHLRLKKSNNQAHSENGKYEQIVSHLERKIELNGLDSPDEMQINTMTQQATKLNPEKPTAGCHHCKKPGHYGNQCRQLKKERNQNDINKNSAGYNNNSNNNSGKTNSNTHNNKTASNGNANSANNRNERKPRTVYPPFETCGKTNHSTEKCFFGANAANRPPPRNRRPMEQNQNQQQDTQINTIESVQAAAQVLN